MRKQKNNFSFELGVRSEQVMNIEAGGFLKLELYNDDATLFLLALTKITKEGATMGFKTYGLNEQEVKVLNDILENLG